MPALHHSYRALSGAWASGAQHDQRRKYQNRAPTWLDVMTSLAGRNLDLVQVMVRSLSDTHPRDDIILWLLEQGSPPRQVAALAVFCSSLGNVTLRPLRLPDSDTFARTKTLGGKPDSAGFL